MEARSQHLIQSHEAASFDSNGKRMMLIQGVSLSADRIGPADDWQGSDVEL
jgi:hypothetical protein